MTQPTTYTENTLTPQASQMQGLINSITSLPAGSAPSPSVAQPAQQQAVSALTGMENNQASNQNNVQQTLNQQTISPLMQQYSNMLPAFQMYQADTQLAQKYMNNQNPNPYSNSSVMSSAMSNPANVMGIQDPYMASPAAIQGSIVPPNNGGFAGFSDPTSAINASNVPISSVPQMLNLVQNAITGQTNRNNTAMTGYNNNYSNTMSGLQTLTNYLSGVSAPGAALTTPGTQQNAAATYQTAKQDYMNTLQGTGKQATWDGLWWYMEGNKRAWEGQGVDVGEMYKLQGQDRTQFGGQGILASGGKAPTAAELKLQTAATTATEAVRGFGDIMQNYWNGSNDVKGVRFINPLSQSAGQIESSKKVYLTALIKQFGASRGKYIYDEFTNSFPGELTTTGNAQGKLQGHLESLLTRQGMVIARNDKKGEINIKDRSQLVPGDVIVKPTTESIPQLLELINGL